MTHAEMLKLAAHIADRIELLARAMRRTKSEYRLTELVLRINVRTGVLADALTQLAHDREQRKAAARTKRNAKLVLKSLRTMKGPKP